MFQQKLLVFLLGLLVAVATPARAQVAYSVDDGNFATTTDQLRRIALAGTGDVQLVTNLVNSAGDVVVDQPNNRAFVADVRAATTKIVSVDLTSGAATTFLTPAGAMTVTGMAIDRANSLLYYTLSDGSFATRTDELRRIGLNGTGDVQVATNFIDTPGELVLDLPNNRALVAEVRAATTKIVSVDLTSGAATTFLTPGGAMTVTGMASNPTTGVLYYALSDGNFATRADELRRVGLNGAGDVLLLTNFIDTPGALGLDGPGNRVLVVEARTSTPKVVEVALVGNVASTFLTPASGSVVGLALFDAAPPTVNITSSASSPTSVSPIPVTVTFSAAVTDFTASDVTVGNGTLSSFTGSGTTYTFDVTPTADGAVTVDVAANAAQDGNGNGNTAAPQFSITYTAPVTQVGWNGNVSTDWYTADNWTPAVVPTPSTDALIPAAAPRYPVIAGGGATADDVTIAAGATLTMSGGTLTVSGNWTTNGSLTTTGGTVAFGGPAVQQISGSAASTFWNVAIGLNNVTLASPVAVQRRLALTGNLTSNGQLTLLSDAAGTAFVNNVGGVVNGTVTVKRYITPNPGAAVGYRFFSPPVTNTTVADLAVTGTFTPVVNGRFNTATNPALTRPYPNVFGFDETRFPAVNDFNRGYFSPAPTPTSQALTAPLISGRGYSVACPAATYDFVGTLATGNVPVGPLTRTGVTDKSGWHILGNPYVSVLDWDLVTVPVGMSSTIYVQQTLGGNNYVYLTRQSNGDGTGTGTLPNGELPTAQGFFAQVTAPGPVSFTFTDAMRVTTNSNPAHYRAAASVAAAPTLSLVLRAATATDPLAQDESFIIFRATGAMASRDQQTASARPGRNAGVPTLATLLPTGEELAINGLSATALTTGAVVELLADVPAAGIYHLTVGELTNLDNQEVRLLDRLTGTRYDLRTQPTMRFTTARAGELRGRFALEINGSRVTGLAATPKLAVWPNPTTADAVHLTLPSLAAEAAVTVLDAAGRVVKRATVPADGTLDVRGLTPGVYAVRVGAAMARLVIE